MGLYFPLLALHSSVGPSQSSTESAGSLSVSLLSLTLYP